jgi:hypothetical protein
MAGLDSGRHGMMDAGYDRSQDERRPLTGLSPRKQMQADSYTNL